MNIKDCNVYCDSNLKDYGATEDGERYIGELYFICVENARGDRWIHNQQFPGCRVELDDFDCSPAFIDIRAAAVASCDALVRRIIAAGAIDLIHWSKGRPVYGSQAYIDYGQADEVTFEKSQG